MNHSDARTVPLDATASIVPERPVDSHTAVFEPSKTMTLMRIKGGDHSATAETAPSYPSGAPLPPDHEFTAFHLHHIVGRGGMGEVWAAEQTSLGRMVAVKRLVRRHADSRDAARIAAFRHEAHIAGILEHPNILPVHDLGCDETGNPLLAMKLIEGRSWSDVLDADWEALSPDEFLSRHIPILMAMTQAVAFAHSRGIVHRDLKPAQVMIGAFGEIVLTDWGLAIRVEDLDAAHRSSGPIPATARLWNLPTPGTASNPAGTPALMAPEQTLEDSSKLGFHTDVYLLGGTLYWLLTGDYPHRARTTSEAMERAALGIVELPSRRAGARPVPPDLEQLCLAALRSDPADRIPSAEAFWQALDDHVRGSSRRARSREKAAEADAALAAQPADYAAFAEILSAVEEARRLWPDNPQCDALKTRALAGTSRAALANGDLALARLQAAAIPDRAAARPIEADVARAEAALRRRHAQFRAAVAAAILLMAVIAAGSALFSRQMRAKNAELEQRTAEAVAARERAEANLAIAKRQGEGAFALVNFVLKDLKSAMDEELTVDRGILVPVANEIAHAIAGRVAKPVVQYFESVPLEEVLAWPPELMHARALQMHETGTRFDDLGRYDEALRLTTPTLSLLERSRGTDDPDYASSLVTIAAILEDKGQHADALPLARRALEIRTAKLGPEDPETGAVLNNISIILGDLGDAQGALELAERVAAIDLKAHGPDDPKTAGSIGNLGSNYKSVGDYAKAREHFERAIAIYEKHGMGDTQEIAFPVAAMGALLREIGDLKGALAYFERAVAIREKIFGPNHNDTARSIQNLASVHREMGNAAAARPLLQRALAINEKTLGPNHSATISTLNGLAILDASIGDFESVKPLMDRVCRASEALYGPDHFRVADSLNNYGIVLRELGELENARTVLERCLRIREVARGPEHPQTAEALLNLANLYLDTEEFPAALEAARRAVSIHESAFGIATPSSAISRNTVASALSRMGRHAEAHAEARYAYEAAAENFGSTHRQTLAIAANAIRTTVRYARSLRAEGRVAESQAAAAEILPLAIEHDIATGRTLVKTALFAEALHLAGRTAEAVPLLKSLIDNGFPDCSPEAQAPDIEAFEDLCRTLLPPA